MENVETKKNGKFKESMKKAGGKVKDVSKKAYGKAKTFSKKAYKKTKEYSKKYAGDLRTAYDVGFAQGWDDAYSVPTRKGAATVAAVAYKKGIKGHRKVDKYIVQYNRQGTKILKIVPVENGSL